MQKSNNFELTFGLAVRTDVRKLRQGGKLQRVISAQGLRIAQKIALAMLGEEVYRGQYLDEVLSVKLTRKKMTPHISTFNHDYTWERVLQALQLQNGDILFVIDSKGRRIGLLFNVFQFKRATSLKL